ncbi:ATP-binding protein [Candidatus Pacearchaeota archaeon]|nr:ATP-binding protein [Candidatus Pacearchaeota archaeon]
MIQRPLSVEEICNKLRPVFGEKVDEIYFQYTIAEGRDDREEIVHILNALYQKHLNQLLDKGVLLEPPREEQINGTYELATISYAKRKLFPFKLREKDWPRHICVTGMSGSGKTTFAFKIIEALNANKKPYLIFDWKKSFRPLSAIDNNIMTFTVGDESVSNLFKTNINRPPKGVAPKEWINTLTDLLTEAFSASFGVHKVILETLDEAFKEWGIYNGSENYPTWNHIKWRLEEKMDKVNNRESGWIESALRVATVLTFGEFGKVVNYKGTNSFSVEDLLNKKVVMELNSLGNIEKTFFCEFVLTYIFKLKKARQNHPNQSFDHAIIVDEAHNIFLKKPTSFSNESTTDMIYREMREYGTSLVCLDQHISKISDTVKGNSACHIAFQQQLPQDIFDISGIMDIKESKNYFSQLAVGNAIVKLAERYTMPFLIEVPNVDLRDKHVSNADIKARMQAMMLNHDYGEKVDTKFNSEIESPLAPKKKPIEIKTEPTTNNLTQSSTSVEEQRNNVPEKIIVNEVHLTTNPLTRSPQTSRFRRITPPMNSKNSFTDVQQMIHDFTIEHLKAGIELEKIEKILEKSKTQGKYTSLDIMTVINKVFENQLVVTFKSSNNSQDNSLTNDEQVFMKFLRENPVHELSTVEVYRKINLSTRKGTNVKNTLIEKGLIKINEIKYDKGWKKIIRPTN